MSTQISIINACSVLTDAQIAAAVPALQKQITNDFQPVWGLGATLTFVPKNHKPTPGTWWVSILDNSDEAGALGYHDLTPDGLPLSKVFAATDLKYKMNWTITLSHELLEMLADPDINLTVFDETTKGGRLYAYEVCDACEDDKFGYKIDNTMVSDFIYPAWFEGFRKPNSTQFDHMKLIHAPFELLSGGYIGVYDVKSGSGWKQITAETAKFSDRPKIGSRRERRNIPKDQWLVSPEQI